MARLEKGWKMLEQASSNGEVLKAVKLIRLWQKLSREMFYEQEKSALIHQQFLTGNSVLVRADGSLISKEDIMGNEAIEVDPWLLLSLEKLKAVFGDDIHNFINIKEGNPPS
jgi:hypothetical protein